MVPFRAEDLTYGAADPARRSERPLGERPLLTDDSVDTKPPGYPGSVSGCLAPGV